LAGLATGYWSSQEEIQQNWSLDQKYTPKMAEEERSKLYHGWECAIKATQAFKPNI